MWRTCNFLPHCEIRGRFFGGQCLAGQHRRAPTHQVVIPSNLCAAVGAGSFSAASGRNRLCGGTVCLQSPCVPSASARSLRMARVGPLRRGI